MDDVAAVDSVQAKALQFCVLTATRTDETRRARWSEVDLEARVWTIPEGRMKAGEEHVIPLSGAHLVRMLFPQWDAHTDLLIKRMHEIKQLVEKQKAHAVVSCFWYGPKDAVPSIDETLIEFFDLMGFEIDTDFIIDEPVPQKVYA
jgi:hypothetical protein